MTTGKKSRGAPPAARTALVAIAAICFFVLWLLDRNPLFGVTAALFAVSAILLVLRSR